MARKLFVPSGSAITPQQVNAAYNTLSNAVAGFSSIPRAKEYATNILIKHGPTLGAAALNMASQRVNNYRIKASPIMVRPVGGTNKTANSRMGSALAIFKGKKLNPESNTSYALSGAPNPKPVSLNSGIVPNTFVNDYMIPVQDTCSPLHMSGASFVIPTDLDNPLTKYFSDTIAFDIQTKCQENVGFGVDLNSLSAANIISTFNATIYALSVYFYYAGILSYESDSRNKNSGMIALRAKITPQIMSDLSQLSNRLEDTCIPPKVVEFVRYLHSTFLSGNTQGAPLLKLFIGPDMIHGTPPAVSYPAQALAGLITPTSIAVNVLLRRCMGKWRIGKLYDPPVLPVFDKNFITIFANLITVNRASGSNVIYPGVPNFYGTIQYCSFTNNLDGLAFSMAGLYDTALTVSYGLTIPSAVSALYPDNRWSYYISGGITDFYPVSSFTYLALSRQEVLQQVGLITYSSHLFGSDKCQNVSGAAVTQSCQNSLDFLFEQSVKSTGSVQQYSQ